MLYCLSKTFFKATSFIALNVRKCNLNSIFVDTNTISCVKELIFINQRYMACSRQMNRGNVRDQRGYFFKW